jgi:hypothetical protein
MMKKLSLIIILLLSGIVVCRKPVKTIDITTQLTLAGEKIPLQVTLISPVGSVEGQRETFKILVGFNQAMTPLQAIPRDETRGPLVFEPPIKGKYRWLGTRTLAFMPSDTLTPATSFQARLIRDRIQSLTGMRLERDTAWAFETVRPSLISSVPYHGADFVGLREPIYLCFNLDMAPEKIGDKIKIYAHHGSLSYIGCGSKEPSYPAREEEIAFKVRQLRDNEKKDWPLKEWDNRKTLVLEPAVRYPIEAQIEVHLIPGLRARVGNLGTAQDHVLSFNTYNDFALVNNSTDIPAGYPLELCFSNPVPFNEVVKNLKIDPPVAVPTEYYDEAYAGTGASLYLDFKPNTQYSVKIGRPLKDTFGNFLNRDYEFTLKVGDYYPYAGVPTGISLIESKSDRRIPATFLNVDDVFLEMGTVSLDEAVPFLNRDDLFNSCVKFEEPGIFSVQRPWPVKAFKEHRNQRLRLPIELKEVLGNRPAGLVYLQFDRSYDECPYLKSFFEVGDLGVTWKYAPENNVVWVTSLNSTAPVKDALVQFRNNVNQVLWQGATDYQGFCEFPGWAELNLAVERQTNEYESEYEMESYSYNNEPKFWLTIAKTGDQAVYSNRWDYGIDPWRFNIDYNWDIRPEEYGGYVFTEKGLYRSGETVHVKGIFRKKKHGAWILPDVEQVEVVVKDSRDETVIDDTWALNSFGSVIFDVPLAADAPTGSYSISIQLPGKAYAGYQSFRVEAYRSAEFEVKAAAEKDTFMVGEFFRGKVLGRYLFGMPMRSAEANWNLSQDFFYLSYPQHPDYVFGGYTSENRGRSVLGSGRGRLNDNGEIKVKAKLSPKDITTPATLTLEGTVTSPSQRSLSGRQNWLVFPASLIPGLKTAKYLYQSGENIELSLIAIRPSGEKVAGAKVDYRVVRQEWKSIQKARLGGRYEWVSEMTETVVSKGQATTRRDSTLVVIPARDPGYYYIEAQVRDDKSRVSKTTNYFYVCGAGYAGWEMRDDDIIELVPDRDLYQVGDTARIMVKSPYDSATALITVERELVLKKFTKKLRGNADFVTIPIGPNDLPNCYVCVTILRGRVPGLPWDETKETDLGKPQFKIGYVNLKVDTKEKHLAVHVHSDRADYRPRDTVTVNFDLNDYRGGAVANGEISLFVVDVGVLNLIDFQTPNPFDYFYGPRSLSVKTVESRLNILGERSYGEKGEERGGGGAVGAAPGIPYREKFLSTVFYQSDLRTDQGGRGRIRFALPDNLTRFRIMAIAQTKNQEFGSADSTFSVNLPFMVTPSLPRFLRVGDRFRAGVLLHNRTKSANRAVLDAEVTGLKMTGSSRRETSIPPNGSQEVLYEFTAETTGTATFAFRGRMGEEQDALKISMPVRLPPFVEAVATFSSTPDSALEGIVVPANIYEKLGNLEVLLSSSVLAGMKRGIEHLLDYPYGCLEQRLSRVLPLIVGEELINRFKLAPVTGQALRDTVQKVLDEVPDYQLENGGFVYFKESIYPCPYLSAYTMYVLKRAQDAGYRVEPTMVDRGKVFLRAVLGWGDVDWTYPYNEYAKLLTRSFCVYSLSLWGEMETAYASRLFERRSQIPIFGKVLLLKAGRNLGMGSQFEEELARIITNKIKLSPTTAHFEESELRGWTFPSPAKVTGFVIQAFTELDIPFSYKDQTIRWLVQERGKKTLPTTHENAFVFDAFQTYYRKYEKEEPDFTARIVLGGRQILSETFKGRTNEAPRKFTFGLDDIAKNELLPIKITKEGTGRLYYTLRMYYAYKENPVPFDEGFYVWKEILTLDGLPAKAFSRGDVYKVVLHIVVPETRIFAVVNDPLPAGFEPVQTFFATESRALQDQFWEDQWNEEGHWWGSFDHEEYYDDCALFFAQELFPGEHTQVYYIRAATSGRFLAPATKAEEMYAPEVFGSTSQGFIRVD